MTSFATPSRTSSRGTRESKAASGALIVSSTSAKFYGEITQNMLKNSSFPGSNNGTGLFQTLIGLKVREVYEKLTSKTLDNVSA